MTRRVFTSQLSLSFIIYANSAFWRPLHHLHRKSFRVAFIKPFAETWCGSSRYDLTILRCNQISVERLTVADGYLCRRMMAENAENFCLTTQCLRIGEEFRSLCLAENLIYSIWLLLTSPRAHQQRQLQPIQCEFNFQSRLQGSLQVDNHQLSELNDKVKLNLLWQNDFHSTTLQVWMEKRLLLAQVRLHRTIFIWLTSFIIHQLTETGRAFINNPHSLLM